MRTFIVIMLFISSCAYSQNDLDSLLVEQQSLLDFTNKSIKEYNLENDVTVECDEVLRRFKEVKRELLSIDDISNKPLQKIVLQPLAEEYYDYFTLSSEGKKINTLQYGFEKRSDLERQIKLMEGALIGNIFVKKNKIIIDYHTAIDNYVDKNLKRLGISRETWKNMSDNDAELLMKKFED